jgi:hypothetical protein
MVTFRGHAQHLRVVLRGDRAQPPIADPHDRGGASVMGVVLVSTFVVEESNPCRQLRRHIQDRLTSSDELLG